MIKTVLLFFLSFSAVAQTDQLFFKESLRKNQKGMVVLGSWGLGNVMYSGASLTFGDITPSQKSFHQMNLGWGAINAAIASLGYVGSKKKVVPSETLSILEEQQKIKQTFLVNGALDFGYMAFGLYLTERSKNDMANEARLKGFGRSIILQGAALAIFDAVMYGVHSSHYNKNRNKLNLSLRPTHVGFTLSLD